MNLDHHDPAPRAVGAIGLAGVALIHLLDSLNTFPETPYIGWMYVGLILGSVAVAGALLLRPDRRVWLAAAALAGSAIAGYVLSRTTGLPASTGDIGDWNEPLGVASLFVEGCVVSLGTTMVAFGIAASTETRAEGERERADHVRRLRDGVAA
jgi:membrane protease YdiL (CAAX protease family)